jgi:hypothetical protein
MGILIRRLFFCECFHLEKVSLNGAYHSKPMAKAARDNGSYPTSTASSGG